MLLGEKEGERRKMLEMVKEGEELYVVSREKRVLFSIEENNRHLPYLFNLAKKMGCEAKEILKAWWKICDWSRLDFDVTPEQPSTSELFFKTDERVEFKQSKKYCHRCGIPSHGYLCATCSIKWSVEKTPEIRFHCKKCGKPIIDPYDFEDDWFLECDRCDWRGWGEDAPFQVVMSYTCRECEAEYFEPSWMKLHEDLCSGGKRRVVA